MQINMPPVADGSQHVERVREHESTRQTDDHFGEADLTLLNTLNRLKVQTSFDPHALFIFDKHNRIKHKQ